MLTIALAACGSDGGKSADDAGGNAGVTGTATGGSDGSTTLPAEAEIAPAGRAFYAGPSPLPRQKAGTLIWSAPIDAPAGARAWKVLYHSRSLQNRDIVVSGVVVVPDGTKPAAGRPVLTWAHGTTGTADKCAPSKSASVAKELPDIDAFVRAGYVVTATDYEGLGTPGLHPYLVGASEGRGVLDIVRAAGQLSGAGISDDVVIFGHSQGGHAALWAGQIAPEYAPELHVQGVVAAAPASDLTTLYGAASALPAYMGYIVMAGQGFAAAYPDLDLGDILTPAAEKETKTAAATLCQNEIDAQFGAGHAPIVTTSPLSVPEWAATIAENTPGAVATKAPTLVVQGGADPLVPPSLNRTYVQDHCADGGGGFEYHEYPGADHSGVMTASANDVQAWIGARFAGEDFVSDCTVPAG